MQIRETLGSATRDVRAALRALRSEPTFTAGVVATLALGIGVNVAMFSVVDRLVLRPPAYVTDVASIRRFYVATTSTDGIRTTSAASYALFTELARAGAPFRIVAAYKTTPTSMGRGGSARSATVSATSASFFALVGAPAVRGRYFGIDDDHVPVGEPVAVLSFAAWQRDFAGDDDVLGKVVFLGARQYRIIGVAPRGFTGVDLKAVDAWVPVSVAGRDMLGPDWYTANGIDWLQIVMRIRDGVSGAQQEAFVASALAAVKTDGGDTRTPPVKRTVMLGPMSQTLGPDRPKEILVSLWVAGVAAIVLLVACANVTNLLLARTVRRRREIAVRLALGISRRRLVTTLLIDGLVLALIGGACGLAVGHAAAGVLGRTLLPDVAWDWMPFDARSVVAGSGIILVIGLAIAIGPAVRSANPRSLDALRSGASTQGRDQARVRAVLMGAQAALCAFMLVGAGLFVRSFDRARALDGGFAADRVIAVTARLRDAGYSTEDASRLFARAVDRVRSIPGVSHASMAVAAPFVLTWQAPPKVAAPFTLPTDGGTPYLNAVDGEYFRTMGIQILRGRAIEPADVGERRRVAVVNETMARRVWPGDEALGKCLRLGSDTTPCINVVGIAHDVHQEDLIEDTSLQYYVPLDARFDRHVGRVLLMRTERDPRTLIGALRHELVALAPGLPYFEVRDYPSVFAPMLRSWRLGAILFAAFGALAAIVAGVGLYSVVSYATAQQRHELALRVALGARTADIIRVVVRGSALPCVAGVAIGLALAALVAGQLQPLLFRTSAHDVTVFTGVAFLLLLTGIAAMALPARRALQTDPLAALRDS